MREAKTRRGQSRNRTGQEGTRWPPDFPPVAPPVRQRPQVPSAKVKRRRERNYETEQQEA